VWSCLGTECQQKGIGNAEVIRGADKKCKVVETKPTDKTIVVVGDKAFVTREEADKQLAVVCKEK
jgi:hypothetical protein